jgi:hypothetical protein
MAQADPDEALKEVLKENPGLANIHSTDSTVVIFADKDRVKAAKDSMAAEGFDGPGGLEYWPKEEEGTPGYGHPAKGKVALEIYSDELMSDKDKLKEAIRGDLLHGMKKDPTFKNLWDEFKDSYTPETKAWLKSKAKAGGDASGGIDRDSTHDAFIRGYLNPDEADEWRKGQEQSGTVYSPKQLDILDKMETYIRTGKTTNEKEVQQQ